MKITNTKDVALYKMKGIVMGPPGTGKTTLARTLLPLGKTLIVSAESGTAPLAGYDIDVVEVKTYPELGEVVGALVTGQLDQYEVIYVDSLTEVGKIIEGYLFARYAVVDEEKGVSVIPKSSNFAFYGALGREQEQFVRVVRDLRKHVFFSALPKHWKNDLTGEEGYRPHYGSASVGELLPGLFDFVFTYRTVVNPENAEPQRVLFTSTVDGWMAKARQNVNNPALPVAIADPDLSVIVRAAIGGK